MVDKPFGLPSQQTQKGEDNLYERLRKHYPTVALHHRLDQTASGLMLLTTDPRWNKAIASDFQQHQIEREYWCWVLGQPRQTGSWKYTLDQKKALTHFCQLESNGELTKLNIRLQTGRTHQIRRHAQMGGYPIIGDRRYGGLAGRLWPRLCLHAHTLCFTHPGTRKRVVVASPLPENLMGIMEP